MEQLRGGVFTFVERAGLWGAGKQHRVGSVWAGEFLGNALLGPGRCVMTVEDRRETVGSELQNAVQVFVSPRKISRSRLSVCLEG
eukprot:3310549-Rhodomonas_salina.4